MAPLGDLADIRTDFEPSVWFLVAANCDPMTH